MGESENIELIVEPSLSGMRLDAYLREQTPFSRSRIASLMEEGALLVNGEVERKAARKTEGGMRLLLVVPEAQPVDIVPQNIPLDILYQDADVVVVNKKSGMVVHPAAGNESGTLVNALLYHVHDLSGIGGEMRPGIVHRLDKDTSGLILIAKNDAAHASLSEQFKARTMEKHYRAIAHGSFSKDEGMIDAPIGRHPIDRKKMAVVPNGKPSRTAWRVLEHLSGAAYLDVHLLTGRTHQIRVHMLSIGHPLLGDQIYAPKLKTPVRIPRLMLPDSWREAFLSACLGCKNALMSYLSGVLKTSLFVFVATLTGLFLLGINDALLLSVFMGILEVFPYIGPILASVPILLTALGQGFGQAVLALIVVIAVQQIEGNFVTPYFTASSTSIKPLSALIGVFVLGSLMGLWGVVLAIPLIVTVRSVLWSIRSAVIMMKPS